jgi:HlyD family secretion protein
MRRRWVLLALLAVLALVAGRWLRGRAGEAVQVDVEPVARRVVFQSFVTASGEIVASRFADIGSSVYGRLVKLAVAEGDRVRQGQMLARIDPVQARSEAAAAASLLQSLEAEARAAQARAQEAQRSFERVRTLHAQGLLAQSEQDSAQAAWDATRDQAGAALDRAGQAQAQLARARDGLAKTEIAAPLDGVVTRLQVREGEMVVVGVQNQPGTILMTVSDLSALNAEVKVAEADVLRLAVGQAAQVTLEAAPSRSFPGRVIEIGASALPVVGTGVAAREFRVVVRLDAPGSGLRPGLTCDARILTQEAKGVLTLPLQAVVLRAEKTGVFLLDAGRARFRPVETGIIGGLETEVRGLTEGTPVITGPFQALREMKDGAAVRPFPKRAP